LHSILPHLQIRIFFFQVLGVLALVCGYFLSDQPDSLSFMNFNPNPVSPNIITKAPKVYVKDFLVLYSGSTQNNSSSKSNEPKYIPLEYLLPIKSAGVFYPVCLVEHTPVLPKNYVFLFCKEINPPPPKSC
jgi:hypothetical protein